MHDDAVPYDPVTCSCYSEFADGHWPRRHRILIPGGGTIVQLN